MDLKSILIGGLGTALLFVSIGAGVQSESTVVQVAENPFPYDIVDCKVNWNNSGAERTCLLNRQTGEVYWMEYSSKPYQFLLKPASIEQ